MDAALQALLAVDLGKGRNVSLADEKILFRVGQKFHRAWDWRNPQKILIGQLCREALKEFDEGFDLKEPQYQKTAVDRLKRKFKADIDFYCSVGSSLVDYDFQSREAAVRRVLLLLSELGLVKGEK